LKFEFKHAGPVEWLGLGGAVVPSARAGSSTPLSSRRVAGSRGKSHHLRYEVKV